MQPFFFISHPAALFAYECWNSYDIYKFIKFFSYILLLPFAKPFRLFSHFVLLYIKILPSGFKLLRIRLKIHYRANFKTPPFAQSLRQAPSLTINFLSISLPIASSQYDFFLFFRSSLFPSLRRKYGFLNFVP